MRKADQNKIRELAEEGYSKAAIARMVGVSGERIRQICQRDGIYTVHGGINREAREILVTLTGRDDITLYEAAKMAGVTPLTARRIFAEMDLPPPRKRTKCDELRELARAGFTLTEAARRLGWSPQGAWNAANRLEITFHVKGKRGRREEA